MAFQLRINAKGPDDSAPGNFHWALVEFNPGGPPGGEFVRTLLGGGDNDLTNAAREGVSALHRLLSTPEGPIRHEFDCPCGAQLSLSARRSRTNPYSWDSLREITCSCGRVYGVKLQFAAGSSTPRLEAIYRTMVDVSRT